DLWIAMSDLASTIECTGSSCTGAWCKGRTRDSDSPSRALRPFRLRTPNDEVGPVLGLVLRTVPPRGDHLLFLEREVADGCGLIIQNEHAVAPDLNNAILRRRAGRGDDPARPPNIDADPEIHGEVIGEVPVVDGYGRCYCGRARGVPD